MGLEGKPRSMTPINMEVELRTSMVQHKTWETAPAPAGGALREAVVGA